MQKLMLLLLENMAYILLDVRQLLLIRYPRGDATMEHKCLFPHTKALNQHLNKCDDRRRKNGRLLIETRVEVLI